MSVVVSVTNGIKVKVVTTDQKSVVAVTKGPVVKININNSLPMPFPVPGPKGEDGKLVLNVLAGEIINGDSVIMVKDGAAFKNDSSDISNIYYCCGFAQNAAGVGENVKVTLCGEHVSAGWGLTPNQIYYANANGGITILPPGDNLSQVVGFAKDANTMIVEIREPFIMVN